MARDYSYRSQWPITFERIQRFTPEDMNRFKRFADFAIQNKQRYIEVESSTTVPWPLVAVIHRRESDADFNTYLGNGQRLSMRTTIEPIGRGPFSSFLEGCIDALKIDGLTGVHQKTDVWKLGQEWGSWPLEKMLLYAEKLNGLGYFFKGNPSPYVWGGTNIQVVGKYISDGHYDPSVMDTQPGCAPILWMIGFLDPSVHFTRET